MNANMLQNTEDTFSCLFLFEYFMIEQNYARPPSHPDWPECKSVTYTFNLALPRRPGSHKPSPPLFLL